ncbi:biopolymer transporter ExbD [Flavobacteriales bacterium]|jgi:biopolymer transport protein ExbD|nr:biopolymer transporter ExbD [Flavobacteriales bacterium]MDB9932339.1 biopolymer transporter ExbD [Flavobacteriales bacterium]MDC0015484.1 biopolymer transporter ExbD [Flavobacteriales bacterium]
MGLISQNKVKIEGGMSSMTDLVFLLLIFFIILSALAKNAVDVDLPEGGSVAPTTQSLASIVVKPDNTILLNNKIIDISELERAVLKAVANDKEKLVELNGDKASDFGIAVEIIDMVKKNKLKIAIMTKK